MHRLADVDGTVPAAAQLHVQAPVAHVVVVTLLVVVGLLLLTELPWADPLVVAVHSTRPKNARSWFRKWPRKHGP